MADFKNIYDAIGKLNKNHTPIGTINKNPDFKASDKIYAQLLAPTSNVLGALQPFIDGRFIFNPATMPKCMEKLHSEATDYMRVLYRTALVSVTGFDSRKLEVGDVQSLSEQNTFQAVTKTTGATRTLTLTFTNMYADLPVFRYINT